MTKGKLLSTLPSVDEILNHKEMNNIADYIPRSVVLEQVRKSIQGERNKILSMKEEELEGYQINEEDLIKSMVRACEKFMEMNLREVINGTGVVLHTNLGRALLSDEIKEEVWSVASGYSTLEINVDTGKRGSRYSHVVEIITSITGAEDAIVVNNNAAAVLLVLGTMAKNKEVIVSRGELVEIGGSFRIPEVMEQSGAKLVEVGATNKTHLRDYEGAIGEETAVLLKVHTSNYKILGFTEETSLKELADLGKKKNIPVVEDLGSGVLINLQKYGLTYEPTVQDSVKAGIDIITFSGDKLLGGPQAGIIIGKKHWIDKMKKNPLTRAFRVDKLTMAALEATLKFYLNEEDAVKRLPTLRMITEGVEVIHQRAVELMNEILKEKLELSIEMKEDFSQVGGGSLPLEQLPTKVLQLASRKLSVNQLEERLRKQSVPIITRIQDDKLIIDLRTIKERDYGIIRDALKRILN